MKGEIINRIKLFAESHAIEVANFTVNLNLTIDRADIRRFDENDQIKGLFPAINSPEVFQIAIGNQVPPPLPNPPVPVRGLNYFGNDGRPEWSGSFGDNQIIVSCRKYTKWDEVWPNAKTRLETLLGCIDPYKPIHSVDYSVTDTFRAQKDEKILIPPKIFKDNTLIARKILGLEDSRWDFSQGWFEFLEDFKEVLIRLDGRGWIENEWVVASIGNLHSQRFGAGIVVRDLLSGDTSSRIDQIYSKFHDQNKALLKRLLVDELLSRMGLKELGTNV